MADIDLSPVINEMLAGLILGLRAKVEALHVYATDSYGDAWIKRSDVLAVFDGVLVPPKETT